MAYVSLQDFKNYAPQLRVSAGSKPNESEVERIIQTVESELDAIFKTLGYAVPVEGDLSLGIVRSLILDETASQVIRQQTLGLGNPENYGAKHLHDRYMERLRMLKDPNDPFSLPDATRSNLQEKLVGEVSSVSSELGTEDDDFRFTRDMVF